MSQMQEDEQEEAKKPDEKRLWRWFYWFTCLSTSLLAFYIVGLWLTWSYRGDWWQSCMFVLVGAGFYLLLCLWQPGKIRIIGIAGTVLWSIVAWSVGYAYASANVLNTPRLGSFLYQSELIYVASILSVLLFLACILLINRQDIVGN